MFPVSKVFFHKNAPFTSIKFPLKNMLFNADKVTWTVINDYGGYQKGESVLK
ncbi:hypothetical protein Q4R23_17840 [Morganella morganii]